MARTANGFSSVLSRYVAREFWAMFRLALAAFVGLYLIVDFFDRLNSFLRHDASAWAIARYLAFKLPLIVTQITPPAIMAAALVSLALLARRNELTALRASGVSLYRIARPILGITAAVSVGVLLWNEAVVPYSTRQSQRIKLVEIRRQQPRPLLSDREIWYHGADGFYNITYIDRRRQTLYGVVLYRVSPDFRLLSSTQIKQARWVADHWEIRGAVERRITPAGDVVIGPANTDAILQHETLADFLEVYRKPDEMSYTTLRRRIQALTRKGINASSYLVDLHLKLAVPFASLVLAFLAIPVAGRLRGHASVAATIGLGIALGFSYWVILALGASLGHNGALPAVAAAWSANILCGLAGVFLFLGAE